MVLAHRNDELFISQRTVTTYLTRLYAKLDVSSRTAAISAALRMGIVAPSYVVRGTSYVAPSWQIRTLYDVCPRALRHDVITGNQITRMQARKHTRETTT